MEKMFNPKIHLKSDLAQELFEQHEIVIDGILIKMWKGHSVNTIDVQQTWNRIKSFTELNSHTDGVNGSIVFSGVMQVSRKEAAEYAVKLGFKVRASVTKKTDFIVLGTENVSPSKVAKAIELINNGADIHFVDELSFLALVQDNIDLIDKYNRVEKTNELDKAIVNDKFYINDEGPNILEGKSFVVSGKFSIARDDLKKMISKFGGKNVSAISSKTDYLLAGDAMGPAKLKKAEKLGIPIISEDDFMNMINS